MIQRSRPVLSILDIHLHLRRTDIAGIRQESNFGMIAKAINGMSEAVTNPVNATAWPTQCFVVNAGGNGREANDTAGRRL